MRDGSVNVILFGETGSGKSSIVNLLAGEEIAQTSPDIDGCTKTCQPYSVILNGAAYTVWDTVGLDEPMVGNTGYLRSIEQVCKLVRNLDKAGGIDLLLFCHRQGRITTITQKNYALLHEVACRKSVPIAIVVTHLEQEKRMEDWWDQNAEALERRCLKFCGHACITSLLDDSKTQESKEVLTHLLKGANGKTMPNEELAESEVRGKNLVKILRERCSLGESDANRVARILAE